MAADDPVLKTWRKLVRAYNIARCYRDLGFLAPPEMGMQNYPRMRFLYEMVYRHGHATSGVVLEIGPYEGGSTVYLGKACVKRRLGPIHAIDLFTGTPGWTGEAHDTEAAARRRIASYGLGDLVTLIRADSQAYPWDRRIDVFHLDGDHSYAAVKADLAKYIPFVVTGGLIVIDDYDAAHPGVRRATHELLGTDVVEVIGVNHQGQQFGSIALRKRPR